MSITAFMWDKQYYEVGEWEVEVPAGMLSAEHTLVLIEHEIIKRSNSNPVSKRSFRTVNKEVTVMEGVITGVKVYLYWSSDAKKAKKLADLELDLADPDKYGEEADFLEL